MTNEELVKLIQDNQNVKENMADLWAQNQGFIKSTVSRFRGYEGIDDLMQQAYIGLHIAAYNYSHEHGVKFLSYADFMIKASIHEYIEDCGQLVRIPRSTVNMKRKYTKVSESMLKACGRKPTDEELRGIMNITEPQLKLIRHSIIFDNMKSLDVPVGNDEDNDILLSDCVSGGQNIEQEVTDRFQAEELKVLLWDLVSRLPGKEPDIITEIYRNGKTRKEAGSLTSIDIGRVRYLENDALKRLGHGKGTGRLKTFLPEYNEV